MRSISYHTSNEYDSAGGLNAYSIESYKYPITVNCAGNFVTDFPFTSDNPEGRNDYYLLYVVRGSMRVSADGMKDRIAESGSIFIFPPHTHYTYTYEGGDTLDYLWAHFTGSFANDLIKECSLTPLPYFGHSEDSGRVSEGFKRLFDAFELKKPLYERSAALYLEEILLDLSSATANNALPCPIESSLRYIHSAYNQSISIPTLAAMENLSNSRYIVVFERHTGLSPTAYINALRIKTAKELLLSTDMSIKQVGLSVGYSDPHFFSRVFKKQIGISPVEYKNGQKTH